MSVFDTGIQLLFLHHVEVHHVSNVQVENPILSVFHTERIPHVHLVPLIILQLLKLLVVREANPEAFPSFSEIRLPILLDELLVTQDCRLLALVLELLDD